MRDRLLSLPRLHKQGIVVSVDLALILLTTWLAYSLRLETFAMPDAEQLKGYLLPPVLALPVFFGAGVYRTVLRYTSLAALGGLARAIGVYALLLFGLLLWLELPKVPRSMGVTQPLLFLFFGGGVRILASRWFNARLSNRVRRAAVGRLVIYGAGDAGVQIANALVHGAEFEVVAFVDDDTSLHGKNINGVRVHAPESLPALIARREVSDVLLAMPSAGRQRRLQIVESLVHLPVHIRSLPTFADIARGKVSVSDIRELEIEDLLGRDPVPPDARLLGKTIAGKVVLVSGAGGSIGSELCRQILAVGPKALLLLDHSEFNLYAIHGELQQQANERGVSLLPLLANVCDQERLLAICARWQPQTIFHAAAYKHVPLVEHNLIEGVRNNVLGTLRLAQAARKSGVEEFILISTDKAVRPTNVMGASKRLAELVLQALALEHEAGGNESGAGTRFAMVRFGNVLGSSGSVVPLFRRQIRDGGPITLTHGEITRFFMTIPEAAQLVLQAAAMAEGGDVFVLDMGEPVRIIDLARRMVELSGLSLRDEQNPEGDIEIRITGLRPGEKLYEELLIGNDPQLTAHPRIMRARENSLPWPELQAALACLERALLDGDVLAVRNQLAELVVEYTPADGIVDWLYLEKMEEPGCCLN